MENKKIIGRLVKIEIVVEISMKYQKAINYKTHINVGINYNMRCIETAISGVISGIATVINYNMRCIETLIIQSVIPSFRDKLQHEMY